MDKIKVRLSWMTFQHMPSLLQLNKACPHPWRKKDFSDCIKSSAIMRQVAEYDGQIIGFIICERHQSHYQVLNLLVVPEYRRCGVGRQLINYMTKQLKANRQSIIVNVRETELSTQLFLKDVGFKATRVEREHFSDTPEDAYVMQFEAAKKLLPAPVA